MNNWLTSQTSPLVIGHRGAKAHAPENTLKSFALARAQGAHGIEFDVHLCKTGEVVVIHDDDVSRTTNGAGKLHDMTLAQLRSFDAGDGERIPTLDEVFDALRDGDFLFNVELKGYSVEDIGLERAVVDIVRRHAVASRVLFSSFNPLSIQRLFEQAPDIARGMLYSPDVPAPVLDTWRALNTPIQFRHPHFSLVTPEYVADWRARNIGVNTWTVNRPDDIRRIAACGVVGIIGDSPLEIFRALGQNGAA